MIYKPYGNSNMDWILVPSIDQVEKIAVQPSAKAWVMVQNEPIFALRVADPMGLITTDYYRFEKYEKPRNEFITADQLEKCLEKLKEDLKTYEPALSAPNQPEKHTDDKTVVELA